MGRIDAFPYGEPEVQGEIEPTVAFASLCILIALAFAVAVKLMPDAEKPKRNIWPGAD